MFSILILLMASSVSFYGRNLNMLSRSIFRYANRVQSCRKTPTRTTAIHLLSRLMNDVPKVAPRPVPKADRFPVMLGTPSYGELMRWSGQKAACPSNSKQKCQCGSLNTMKDFKHISCAHDAFSITRLSIRGCQGTTCLYYCVTLTTDQSLSRRLSRKFVTRSSLATKLYWRYLSCKRRHSVKKLSAVHIDELIPGRMDKPFLLELYAAVRRKYDLKFSSFARTVSPDLYSLWCVTSHITTELFADSFNESGVLPGYCSLDADDGRFESLGSWEEVETRIHGGGCNPPFETQILHRMMEEFDKGACGFTTYCRCAILPLGKTHGVLERTKALTLKGMKLVTIPAGSLAFKRQESFLCYNITPRVHSFQELGLFVWRNREFLQQYSPPQNIKLLYMDCISKACKKPAGVFVDFDAFARAFPLELRTTVARH